MKEYSKTRFWQTQILSRNPQSWEIPHCVWKNVQKLIFGQTKNHISHDQTNLSVKNLNMSYQKSSEFGNFHNMYEWMCIFGQTQKLSRNPQRLEISQYVSKSVQKLVFGQTKNFNS